MERDPNLQEPSHRGADKHPHGDYEPPELTDLGDVSEITAGLTIGGADAESIGSPLISDRALRQDFAPADVHDLLERAVALPLSSWSYRADPEVRHVGPMAQDFNAAFGLDRDDGRIRMVDAFGVLLGCVQALHAQLQERDAQISALWAELEALRGQVGASRYSA